MLTVKEEKIENLNQKRRKDQEDPENLKNVNIKNN
jgi:hypothetical protein